MELEPSATGRGRVQDAIVKLRGKGYVPPEPPPPTLFSMWYDVTPELEYGRPEHAEERARRTGEPVKIVPAGRMLSLASLQVTNVPNRDSDKGGACSDPYLRIKLLDDSGDVVHDKCTKFLRNEANPAWKGRVSLPMPPRVSMPPCVRIEVWDKDWQQEVRVAASAGALLTSTRTLSDTPR